MPPGPRGGRVELRDLLRGGLHFEEVDAGRRGLLLAPRPVEVVRPRDLLRLRFSFVNLAFDVAADGSVGLVRRVANQPALLVVDHPPQHLMEVAGRELATPPVQWPSRPVGASLSRHARLVFQVGGERLPWTLEGLLDACARLPLNLAPAARREPSRLGRLRPRDLALLGDLAAGRLRAGRLARGRVTARTAAGIAGDLAAGHRALAASRVLGHRLDEREAVVALAGLHASAALGLGGVAEGLVDGPVVGALRPRPRRPEPDETSIELPWRLALSPGPQARFAHAVEPVEHSGRVELWHSRLARDAQGTTVESGQWVRAIWARDFDQFPAGLDPASPTAFLDSDGAGDAPHFGASLTSVRRMKISHETSNFGIRRGRGWWEPPVVDVNGLMLTSQGGWLDSSFRTDTIPTDQLNLLQWRHVATMGRDQYVKTVELGFLLPFGHRAVLTTVTERKLTSEDPSRPPQPGNPAYTVTRQFVTVVERTRTYTDGRTYADKRAYTGTGTRPRNLVNVMPFASVSVLTENTPLVDPHAVAGDPLTDAFFPRVGGTPFAFRMLAADREGHVAEFSGPLMFVASPLNTPATVDAVVEKYWNSPEDLRRHPLAGQQLAYAPSSFRGVPLSTTLATRALYWDAAHLPAFDALPPGNPRFAPMLREAKVVVPALNALAGKADAVTVTYPDAYARDGLVGNAAHVFLAVANDAASKLDFGSQSNRSGALVVPNLAITGLSGSSGPIGGDLAKAVANTATPADFFAGMDANLFGIVPIAELLESLGVDAFPKFVADTVNGLVALEQDLARVVALATEVPARVQALPEAGTAEATALKDALTAVAAAAAPILSTLASYAPGGPLAGQVATLAGTLGDLATAVAAAPFLPRPLAVEAAGVVRRLQDHTSDAARLVQLADLVAQGASLPESVSASLSWSTSLQPWPSFADAVFQPLTPQRTAVAATRSRLDLRVEVKAPVRPGAEPSASATCTLSPFALRLVGQDPFIALNVRRIEFAAAVGRKVDVSVDLFDDEAVEFGGPLRFVNALRELIPFDGFSDPPYLDVSPSGIKAGFDLALPDLPLGVVNLSNLSLGAQLNVPFIGESLDFRFSFCTRERPFHLTVWVFGGGGFFAVTVTPKECRTLEAAFEFGAAVSLDFGVASGSLEVMAGIYFRLEQGSSELTGYLRMRGEVDVLGIISASIELYLELSYEIDTKTARGRAQLTIEVEVLFFSASVTIECEKKFKGSDQDPDFVTVMGPAPGGDVADSPWAAYCDAFAAA